MSVDRVDFSSGPVVRRSRRNGNDRAYVKVGDRDIGYRDLASGEIQCRQTKHFKAVAAATADLWAEAQEALRTAYRPRHAALEDDCGLVSA